MNVYQFLIFFSLLVLRKVNKTERFKDKNVKNQRQSSNRLGTIQMLCDQEGWEIGEMITLLLKLE